MQPSLLPHRAIDSGVGTKRDEQKGDVYVEGGDRAIARAQEVASTMTPEQSERYGRLVEAITAQAASAMESGLSADAAAKVIAQAVTARKPRTR